jgi:hypothetical protein
MPRALVLLLLAACGATSDPLGPDGGQVSPDAGEVSADAGAQEVWQPAPGTSWQWQLTGTIDTSIDVAMYDVDLFEAPDAKLEELHAAGRIVICYFSAGSHEDWREDAGSFPAAALGDPLDGWEGERWLDIRDDGVRTVMKARLDRAAARGCDGVEPDNVDGYANTTGFPLTAADQLSFNRFLAAEAHARGLSVGLKNDLDQIEALVADFDWALDEECVRYDECDLLLPFLEADKAVFHAEYATSTELDAICAVTGPLGLSTIVKNLDLDSFRLACP